MNHFAIHHANHFAIHRARRMSGQRVFDLVFHVTSEVLTEAAFDIASESTIMMLKSADKHTILLMIFPLEQNLHIHRNTLRTNLRFKCRSRRCPTLWFSM